MSSMAQSPAERELDVSTRGEACGVRAKSGRNAAIGGGRLSAAFLR
jgi:hypothetical protein